MKTTPTYIVTGTTRGIGQALAKEIVRRGFKLLTLNRRPDGGDGFQHNLRCDLSDPAQVRAALNRAIALFDAGTVSDLVLINNAGILDPIVPIERITDQQARRHLQTNLLAPMQLISQFIDQTSDTTASRRIINIISGAASHAYAGWSLYCGAKAALSMVSKCVALEQSRRSSPVSICALAPGIVDTDMQGLIRATEADDFPMRDKFIQFQTQGHLSPPAKVAELIIDLDLGGQLKSGGIYDLRRAQEEDGRLTIAPEA